MKSDDYINRIRRPLAHHRIRSYRFEHRGKHRAVVVVHGGRQFTYIFPASGVAQATLGPENGPG